MSFDQQYPNARAARTEKQAHWRPGLRPISLDGLDWLGADDNGKLYWDDKPLQVEQRFKLTLVQAFFGAAVALTAISSGAVATLDYFSIKWPWW